MESQKRGDDMVALLPASRTSAALWGKSGVEVAGFTTRQRWWSRDGQVHIPEQSYSRHRRVNKEAAVTEAMAAVVGDTAKAVQA